MKPLNFSELGIEGGGNKTAITDGRFPRLGVGGGYNFTVISGGYSVLGASYTHEN